MNTPRTDAALKEHDYAGDGFYVEPDFARQLESELEAMRQERDLAIAYDTQPYPTADAYERVCETMHKVKAELEASRRECAQMKCGRKVFICKGCGGVYADEPVTACDCTVNTDQPGFEEGFIVAGVPTKDFVRREVLEKCVEALNHAQVCGDCGEGSWEDCEEGRQALEALKAATAELA